MCDYCQHVLAGVTIRHTKMDCLYRRSMYCVVCAAYGHAVADCPNKVAWAIRRGQVPSEKNLTLIVKNTEDCVKGVLRAHGITPGTRQLQNRKLLRDLGNCMTPPHMIVFQNP